MSEDIIRVTIVGSDADGGDVRLSDFIEQLNAIKNALRETEHGLYGGDTAGLEFRIIGLSHSSPSTVLMKAITPKRHQARARRLCNTFVTALSAIKTKKKAPAHADLSSLSRIAISPSQ